MSVWKKAYVIIDHGFHRKSFGSEDKLFVTDMVTDLPSDFSELVELLSPQIILCPPKQFRHILCDWTGDTIFLTNKGDIAAAALEKAKYKPLLAHVPKRCSTNTELHNGFKLLKD